MGTIAALGYGVAGLALLAAGRLLYARESMDGIPLYDAEQATDPAALSRVVAYSLAAFGLLTLAFGALEAFDSADEVVVAAYTVSVMVVAVVTAGFTRRYE